MDSDSPRAVKPARLRAETERPARHAWDARGGGLLLREPDAVRGAPIELRPRDTTGPATPDRTQPRDGEARKFPTRQPRSRSPATAAALEIIRRLRAIVRRERYVASGTGSA